MSLLAASSPAPPHAKRPYDEDSVDARGGGCGASKRGRARGSPGRRVPTVAGAAYAPGPTTLAALCALFPDMAEQVRREEEEEGGRCYPSRAHPRDEACVSPLPPAPAHPAPHWTSAALW